MFSSDRQDWETPGWLLDRVELEFGNIELDAAASPTNNVCDPYLTAEDDGLTKAWDPCISQGGLIWVNPPYGRTHTPAWIEKALTAVLDSKKGAHVAVLIPARTETTWFHKFCLRGDVYFLKGRVHFCLGGVLDAAAPFPSALIHFTQASVRRAEPECYFVDWRE
jgi:phage N-6-adenine-methyltransferase